MEDDIVKYIKGDHNAHQQTTAFYNISDFLEIVDIVGVNILRVDILRDGTF